MGSVDEQTQVQDFGQVDDPSTTTSMDYTIDANAGASSVPSVVDFTCSSSFQALTETSTSVSSRSTQIAKRPLTYLLRPVRFQSVSATDDNGTPLQAFSSQFTCDLLVFKSHSIRN